MEQLSNLDASFLYLESSRTPMHIGCVLTFAAPATGAMSFERFKQHIASQLGGSPVFRRRLSRLPLDLDRPYWVEDDRFSIDNHMTQAKVNNRDKTKLINRFFAEKLNTRQPLWAMQYIEEKDAPEGQFSVLIKFHHAALDGVSGEKILASIMSPSMHAIAIPDDSWKAEQPSATVMAANKLRSWVNAPKELSSCASQLTDSVKRSQELRKASKLEQPAFFGAPATPFNKPIEGDRHLCSSHLSLAKIKAIKNTYPGCTVNDVVLALCSTALREQLLSQGQLPTKPIISMSPVNKRQGSEQNEGNLISAMLVSLATNIDSPIGRLEAIQKNTQQAKQFNREISMEQVISRLPSLPSSLVLKAYTRLRLAKPINPVFNLIITNVPGSPKPLYLDGSQLLSMEGMAPIVDNMGLTLVVTSYIDSLTISTTTTTALGEQANGFTGYLQGALDELYNATVTEYKGEASPPPTKEAFNSHVA